MNVVTAPFEGIGASVRRKEDLRFLSGRGQYTDDISAPRPGPRLHPPQPARPCAHRQASTPRRPAPCRAWSRSTPARTRPKLGGIPCGWQINNKDGSPMAEPKHPVLAEGKARHVGDPVAVVVAETRAAGQGRGRGDRGRVRRAAGARRPCRTRSPPARRCSTTTRPATSATTGTSATRRSTDAAFARAAQGRPLRDHQQPPGAERHGAARRPSASTTAPPASTRSGPPARTRTSSAC